MAKELRNEVTFKDPGNGRSEMTATGYDWVVGQMMEMSNMGLEQCLDKMTAIFVRA